MMEAPKEGVFVKVCGYPYRALLGGGYARMDTIVKGH